MTGRDRDTCHLSYLSKSTDYLKKKQKSNSNQNGSRLTEIEKLKKKKKKKHFFFLNAANEFLPLFAALQQHKEKEN